MEKENLFGQVGGVLKKKKPKKKEKEQNTLPRHKKKTLVAGILWAVIGLTFFFAFFFIIRSGSISVKQRYLTDEVTALKEQLTELQMSNTSADNLEVFAVEFLQKYYGTVGIEAKDYTARIQPYFASGIEAPDIKNLSGSKTVENIQLWEKKMSDDTIVLEYLVTYSYYSPEAEVIPEPEPMPEPEPESESDTEEIPEGEGESEPAPEEVPEQEPQPEGEPVTFMQLLSVAQTVALSEEETQTGTEIIHFEVKKSEGRYSVVSYPYMRSVDGITATGLQKDYSGWSGNEQTSSTNKEDIEKWLSGTFFPRYFQSLDWDDVRYIMREPFLLGNLQAVQGIKEIQAYDNDGDFLVKVTVQVADIKTNFVSLQEYTIELSKESDQKYFVEKITHTIGDK